MSEYNIQMNKYNALNAGYDQLYPNPMKHANTHAKDGSDPITPASIGAYTKGETDTLLVNKVGVYSRADIGNAPNFDNPGVNGLFEVRSSDETPNETGIKPFDGFGPLLNLKTPDNIAMLQIAGRGEDFYIRARQAADVTMKDVPWNRIPKDTDLDTKVSKSGDTMTGDLNTGLSDGIHGKIGSFYSSSDNNNCQFMDTYNPANNSGIRLQIWANKNDPNITADAGLWIYLNGAFNHLGNLLRTDNAQPLGFPKIAIGSYVGTGTSDPFGGTQQNSLTFDFEPKMLAVVADGGNMFFAGFLIVRGQTYSDGIGGMANTSVASNLHITWSGNTVSWWSSNRTDVGTKYPQMNVENTTYRYVALG